MATSRVAYDEHKHPRSSGGRWARKAYPGASAQQLHRLRSQPRPAMVSDLDPTTPLEAVEFAVLDNETTGLDPTHDQIVQVAVVHCRGDGRVSGRWSTYIRPRGDYHGDQAAEIHHIPPHLIEVAPTFAEAVPRLAAQLDGSIIVAHNTAFDFPFLVNEFAREGYRVPDSARLCTRNLAREEAPGIAAHDGHALGSLCENYGVTITDPHRADADAEATAELLPLLLRRIDCATVADLSRLDAFEGDALGWPTHRAG